METKLKKSSYQEIHMYLAVLADLLTFKVNIK